MSQGCVFKGELVCPYHGWIYDNLGKVSCVPSEGPQAQPSQNLKLKNFPCIEQDGVIWFWMGLNEELEEKPCPNAPPF